MDVLVLLFFFSCGVSVGIVLGRRDERRKAAARSTPAVPEGIAPPVVAPVASVAPVAPTDSVTEPPSALVTVAPAPEPSATPLEPAVAAALRDADPLEPVPRLVTEPNKKGKKAGLDPAAFTMRDDILERLRRAEEIGVQPEVARELLADPPPPRVPLVERDQELAERERRILERLAQQESRPDDSG